METPWTCGSINLIPWVKIIGNEVFYVNVKQLALQMRLLKT